MNSPRTLGSRTFLHARATSVQVTRKEAAPKDGPEDTPDPASLEKKTTTKELELVALDYRQ